MKQIYNAPTSGKKVVVVNGIVTDSDTEFCVVGQKPNKDFLKNCGWKKMADKCKVTDIFGGVRYETIYR